MLKELLRNEFNEARKSGDNIKKHTLEAVIAAILLKEKKQKGSVLEDEEVLDCILKEIKVQQEIADMYKDKDEEKYNESLKKIQILKGYLPNQLTEEVVMEMIEELDEYEDCSNKTKGMIIKNLMPKIKGRFDKSKVNALVVKYLEKKASK